MITSVSNLIESNNLPVFINNLNTHHSIKLMSKVKLNISENELPSFKEDNPLFNLDTTYFVVSHKRDCDGTPVYYLANTDHHTAIQLVQIFRTERNEISLAKLFKLDHLLTSDKNNFKSIDHVFELSDFLNTLLQKNISEESLVIL